MFMFLQDILIPSRKFRPKWNTTKIVDFIHYLKFNEFEKILWLFGQF